MWRMVRGAVGDWGVERRGRGSVVGGGAWSWRAWAWLRRAAAMVVAAGQSDDGGDGEGGSIERALTSVRLPFLPPALPAFFGALADFLDGVLAILRVGVLSCDSNHRTSKLDARSPSVTRAEVRLGPRVHDRLAVLVPAPRLTRSTS